MFSFTIFHSNICSQSSHKPLYIFSSPILFTQSFVQFHAAKSLCSFVDSLPNFQFPTRFSIPYSFPVFDNMSIASHIGRRIVAFTGVSQVFHRCFTGVSRVFHGCSTGVSQVFLSCFFRVSWVFHGCFTGVSRVFHGCFTGVSRVFIWAQEPFT